MTPASPDHPQVIRHNQLFCRIEQSRPGHKKRHARFRPRMRDLDFWMAMGGSLPSLSHFYRHHGPGAIAPLKHALPFHMFPLSDRIEATRRRAKGGIL